jgi:microcystin-dependent protein
MECAPPNPSGTTYGAPEHIRLPDLRGRLPLHFGDGFSLAETRGGETEALTVQQIPAHSHTLLATTNFASAASPHATMITLKGQELPPPRTRPRGRARRSGSVAPRLRLSRGYDVKAATVVHFSAPESGALFDAA